MALVYGHSHPLLYKILKLPLIRFFAEFGFSPPSPLRSHSCIVHLVAPDVNQLLHDSDSDTEQIIHTISCD